MNRRDFITTAAGGLLAAPLAARAPQAGKIYRTGMLETSSLILEIARDGHTKPMATVWERGGAV